MPTQAAVERLARYREVADKAGRSRREVEAVLERRINLDGAAGFPNGRLAADPVVDVTLAVLLLDLSAPGQDAATLANLPLNPPENDVPFLDEFPYFADPN